MPIYLYSIDTIFFDGHGLVADKGMRLSAMAKRTELDEFRNGVVLELRRPDNSIIRTNLFNSGIAMTENSDGTLSGEDDPYFRLTLPLSLSGVDIPAGTAIWWRDDEKGLSEEEVTRQLTASYEPSSTSTPGDAVGGTSGSGGETV